MILKRVPAHERKSISEPVHFWTHVDRNFFAYFGVGNTQEKFVT